ncbi:hypothetical protein RT97_00335 [Variovorax paradoxus]|uniref:Uncharacterized protein n=1 Tax=Variovorax paradoxus TaxID=34073 RepID=A0A0D0LH28_VARPD|nr:hypothetical protein [Variovorax paradoxus]KIQ37467.1 hypothetical protein RT97_00335 [Variovorax paradoxus]
MALTPEQQQDIREEEYFRMEVRKSLAAPQGPPSLMDRLSAFGDSKVGFWLLTTVLAGLVATGFTKLQRYVDQEDIARRELAERSRRDADMLLKLGPLLTSDKRPQVDMAIVLLNSLSAGDGIDKQVSGQIVALFRSTAEAGNRPNATPEERVASQAIYSFFDQAGLSAMQAWGTPAAASVAAEPAPAAAAPSLVAAALDSATLPIRIYLQVGDRADWPVATKASEGLRQAGMIVPGIELVPAQNTPKQNSVRYCKDKVSPAALDRVRTATASQVVPAPAMTELPPKLCGNVRFNHFELWFARGA